MADLSVNIGSLMMSNPVMTASGTFGYGKEFEEILRSVLQKAPLECSML